MTNKLSWLVVAMISVALVMPGAVLAKTYKIGVTVIVSHPALESDQKGFEKAIADAGLKAESDNRFETPVIFDEHGQRPDHCSKV